MAAKKNAQRINKVGEAYGVILTIVSNRFVQNFQIFFLYFKYIFMHFLLLFVLEVSHSDRVYGIGTEELKRHCHNTNTAYNQSLK